MQIDTDRDWRVGHTGRDQMYYEELHDGRWERIEIQGEMLTGRAHHVIYFATPAQWASYPAWAQGRRDEIIARIRSEFLEPDYEHWGIHPGAAAPATAPPQPERLSPRSPTAHQHQGRGALFLAVVLLAAFGLTMAWMVAIAIIGGETPFPARAHWLRRPVVRADEPAMFWVATGLYATLSAGTLILGALGVRAGRRLKFW
jgi:hypothetical protein